MSGMLRPVLWVLQVRSSGSRHWRSVPGHEQELLPDRTVPQAGPSATPVTETGNGPASLWKNTDPAPGKREISVTTYFIFIPCMPPFLKLQIIGRLQDRKLTCMSTCFSDWPTLPPTNFLHFQVMVYFPHPKDREHSLYTPVSTVCMCTIKLQHVKK